MIDGGPVPLITQFGRIDRFLYCDDSQVLRARKFVKMTSAN